MLIYKCGVITQSASMCEDVRDQKIIFSTFLFEIYGHTNRPELNVKTDIIYLPVLELENKVHREVYPLNPKQILNYLMIFYL